MTLWGIITFLVIGLVSGLIARAFMPGRQSMGLLATTLLGCAGAFVGGLVGSLLTGSGNVFELSFWSVFLAVVGAMLLLLLLGATGRSRRVHA